MTKTEAIEHFKTQANIARQLNRAKSTVSEWPEKLPRGVQFELAIKSKGALKVDIELLSSEAAPHLQGN